jgi:OOP family OmpA-OmpF porin
MKTKLLSLAAILSLMTFGAQAQTHIVDSADIQNNGKGAYVVDSDGDIVRDSWNRCVRTNYWTTETAINKCEGIVEPKPKPVPIAVAPVIVVAPVVVAEPVVIAVPPKYMVHFDFDGMDVKTAEIPELEVFTAYMNRECSCKVAITGHTDSTGPAAYNQALSEERAQEVAEYLANKGVVTDRMMVTGMGEAAPIASNKTKAGRAENRRVEVEIVK